MTPVGVLPPAHKAMVILCVLRYTLRCYLSGSWPASTVVVHQSGINCSLMKCEGNWTDLKNPLLINNIRMI